MEPCYRHLLIHLVDPWDPPAELTRYRVSLPLTSSWVFTKVWMVCSPISPSIIILLIWRDGEGDRERDREREIQRERRRVGRKREKEAE